MKCLASFGRRLGKRKAKASRASRPALHDAYSNGINRWLDFCRSRHYMPRERCLFENRSTKEYPTKCHFIQNLRPMYRDLKCPFCVRKREARQSAPMPNRPRSVRTTSNEQHRSLRLGASTLSSPSPPLPNVLSDDVITIRYSQLDLTGNSNQVSTKLRLVELDKVAETTSAQKGLYPTYNLVSNRNRFLLPSEVPDIEWTLTWSKHRVGITCDADDGDEDYQILSLLHHGHLAAIMGTQDEDQVERTAKKVWDHVSAKLPLIKRGFTTKRTSGAGGVVHFPSMSPIVEHEVHRKDPWFVQINPTTAYAVYISAISKRRTACATLVGGCMRGGGTFPTINTRADMNAEYRHFLDNFSVDRVNSARVVAAVNRFCKLRIAHRAIKMVEAQWQSALLLAQKDEAASVDDAASHRGSAPQSTLLHARMARCKTRGQKRKFRKEHKVPVLLYGVEQQSSVVEAAVLEVELSHKAKHAAVAYLSTLNEVTVVADPVGVHMDTFNGATRTGYESKAVFAIKATEAHSPPPGRPTRERIYTRHSLGGILYFPDFGFSTFCTPNVDLEYHVCGRTYHCVSEPKLWSQGRGGGSRGSFCFALCDHPKK